MLTVKVNAFELRKLILDTNMPITDDLWKFLNDMDLEHTDSVVFITKDGKELEFVKTVDAEPVVRCDDCIYRDGKTPGQPNILCWQMHVDDFCSYGTRVDERREDNG